MKQTSTYGKRMAIFLFLLITAQAGLQAQSYFAGSGAGFANTSVNSTAVGVLALSSGNSGSGTAAFGYYSLRKNTSGQHNSALGTYSLSNNTTGSDNTAMGYFSLQYNTNGTGNTAIGSSANAFNTTGYSNTSLGGFSLSKNNTGNSNTALGFNTLYNNTTGRHNIAVGGYNTLYANTSGSYNIALGLGALTSNTVTNNNVAIGLYALTANTGGSNNIAVGPYSSYQSTTASNNIAMGNSALYRNSGANNVAIGQYSGVAQDAYTFCSFLGNYTDATANNLINATAIGYSAKVTASNSVVVGSSSVTSIGGQVGWTTLSDLRLKTNVNKGKLGLNFILSLNPVTYNYKAEGQKGIEYNGLIAQEVDEAATKAGVEKFSAVDRTGEYWGIRYGELTVPLIKAMQELNDKQEAAIEELKKEIAELKANKGTTQNNGSTIESKSKEQSILFQNQPNPFNQSTVIRYQLKAGDEKATIVIRNLNGSVLKQMNVTRGDKGLVTLNANEMAAGTYTYTLVVNGTSMETKLMVLVK